MRGRFSIALVQRPSGDLLLLRRAPDRLFAPGLWGFPAGHIEPGESPGECIERELREELGPALALRRLAARGPVAGHPAGSDIEVYLFHYRFVAGEIVLNEEHTDHLWASAQALDSLALAPGVREDIACLGLWRRDGR